MEKLNTYNKNIHMIVAQIKKEGLKSTPMKLDKKSTAIVIKIVQEAQAVIDNVCQDLCKYVDEDC